MILRALTMAGAVTGAAGLSQFPEFSQQYMQRLGGAVDELGRQVEAYKADAAAGGLDLDTYLRELAQEGDKASTQAGRIRDTMSRHERLSDTLASLEGAGPFMRARLAANFSDRDIAARAYETFEPAVPATFEGAIFAGTGFVGGWAALAAVFAFFRRLWSTVSGLGRKRTAG